MPPHEELPECPESWRCVGTHACSASFRHLASGASALQQLHEAVMTSKRQRSLSERSENLSSITQLERGLAWPPHMTPQAALKAREGHPVSAFCRLKGRGSWLGSASISPVCWYRFPRLAELTCLAESKSYRGLSWPPAPSAECLGWPLGQLSL